MRGSWFVRVLLLNLVLAATLHGIRPIVSYRALALDAGPVWLGVIAACFGVLSAIIAVPIGRWIDRFGEPRFMVGGTAIVALSAVVLATAQSLPLLALGMAMLGLGQILAAVGVQTLIANGGSPEKRDTRFATQTVNASLGQFAGPAIAGLIVADAMGRAGLAPGSSVTVAATDGVFWAGAGFALVGSVMALSLWLWPPTQHARHLEATEDGGDDTLFGALGRVFYMPSMPHALLASLAALSSIDILIAYLPAYGEHYDIPVEVIGFLLAARGLASISARVFMVPLRKLAGRRNVLIGSLLIPGIALAALPFAGTNEVMLLVAIVLAGFGLGLCQPLTLSWIASIAPFNLRSTAIAARLTGNRLGQFLVPIGVGVVAGASSVAATFIVIGAVLALSSLLVGRGKFS